MTFIGIHITNEGIALSTGQVITEEPFFGRLFEACNGHNPVLYDLDADTASLLYLIGITKEQGQKLLETEKLWLSPYKITYFPGHFLSIDYSGGRDHPYLNFANMNQAGYHDAEYTNDNSLDDAIQKAKVAKTTAEAVDSILCKLGLTASNLVSPSSTFLKKFSLNWPTMNDCPEEVSDIAWRGCMGQFFEAYTLGFFEEAYDYDLNASYLAELSKLPDIRKGTWVESIRPPNDATLGITEGILTTDAPFHPFITKYTGSNYTPTSRFPAIMTLQSLEFLKYWDLGTFQAEKGHWWTPRSNFEVYKGPLMFLWNVRQGTTGRERLLIQRIYSALWGKMLQHSDTKGFGDRFNSIIGLTVETNSRLHVAEACLQAGIIPLAVMADGFITTDMLTNLPLSTELGGWRLSAKGRCAICGTGMVAFEGKDTPAELAIDYTTLKNQIDENPDATQYTRSAYSPVTLALALQQDWSKLGQIQLIERTLTIGTENKRCYLDKPKTGKDLLSRTYDSLPWDYKELTMLHKEIK